MEIKLKGKVMPRNAAGDAHFKWLNGKDNDEQRIVCLDHGNAVWDSDEWIKQHENCNTGTHPDDIGVQDVFTDEEIVELVNRALYQLEYQAAAHRKRGQAERDKMKKLKEELKKAGKDVKATLVERELKGE